MKNIILTLTLILLAILPAGAVRKVEGNPINIAAVLVEKTDSANVASTLEYYGYVPQGTEDGYQVMKHPNGSEIRYSFRENGNLSKFPTVIVKHNHTQRETDSRLKELDLKKAGNGYVRVKSGQSRYATQCYSGHHGTLEFRRTER